MERKAKQNVSIITTNGKPHGLSNMHESSVFMTCKRYASHHKGISAPSQKDPRDIEMRLSSIFISSCAHINAKRSSKECKGTARSLTPLLGRTVSNQVVRSQSEAHLERGQNAAGDDDEKPKVHVEELANHVGHVCWEYEEEQAEAHSTEVFPQAPGQTQESLSIKAVTIRRHSRRVTVFSQLFHSLQLLGSPYYCGPLGIIWEWEAQSLRQGFPSKFPLDLVLMEEETSGRLDPHLEGMKSHTC